MKHWLKDQRFRSLLKICSDLAISRSVGRMPSSSPRRLSSRQPRNQP
jgi:hypothetical protein